MSEVRLVRCPKCSKVLQEPLEYAVYQCGACGAFLKAKRSEKLMNCDKESGFYMADRSPARSVSSDDAGVRSDVKNGHLGPLDSDPNPVVGPTRASRSPMREVGYGGFGYDDDGSLVRSRDKGVVRRMDVGPIDHLDGLDSDPGSAVGPTWSSRSPMREGGYGDDGSLGRLRDKGVVRPMNVGPIDHLGGLDPDPGSAVGPTRVHRSPMREVGYDGVGVGTPMNVRSIDVAKLPLRDGMSLVEFDESLPKSPMRERFLNDLGSIPNSGMRSRGGSRSSRDFDFGGVEVSQLRPDNASRSPLRERGASSGMSVRTRDFKSPAISGNDGVPESPMRGDNFSEYGKNKKVDTTQYGPTGDHFGGSKMEPKASFSSWVSGDQYAAEPRRRTWRDRVDKVGPINDGRESMYGIDRNGPPQISVDNPLDVRFGVDYVPDSAKSRRTRGPWVPRKEGVVLNERVLGSLSSGDGYSNYSRDYIDGYGYPRHSFDSPRGAPSIKGNLELEHAELLRKYKELKNQLSDLEGERYYSGASEHSMNQTIRFKHASPQRPQRVYCGPGRVPQFEEKYDYGGYRYDDPFYGQGTRAPRPGRPHPVLDEGSTDLYDDKARYHHPSCTCSQCYVSDWHDDLDEAGSFTGAHRSTRSLDIERLPGPRAYNPRMALTTPQKRPPYAPQKRVCHPVSGGAPFVLCKECYRMLKLPKKLMAIQTVHHQLRCGACSTVMSFDFQNSSIIPSSEAKPDPTDAPNSPDEAAKDPGSKQHHRNSDAATSTNFGSYDFDSMGCGFQNTETSEVSKEKTSGVTITDTERLSRSSSHSDSASVHSCHSASMKTALVRPPPGSPLKDHFDYSTILRKNEADDEKDLSSSRTSVENNDAATMGATATTEIDVPSSEVPPKLVSHDSWDTPKEEDKVGTNNKDKKSPVTNFIKWGFGGGSHVRAEVSVNGQALQPHLVKRAEKLAGPIQPGDYWYDSKAGFWGVMGGRCLGIIPPFIQEFNIPIPKDCSGGDTTVCVNGRELHQRDLNLLATRGLPLNRNKSYIIDISGKVLDEETKEFIANLGKLAPTVEKKKRGFGMQVPEESLDD